VTLALAPVLSPVLAVLSVALLGVQAHAQEKTVVINEVISSNRNSEPRDINGGTPDMIEIYNTTDKIIVLGTSNDLTSYFLSDSPEFDPDESWRFPAGVSSIPPGERLVIFCDGTSASDPQSKCELHASFQISNRGSEPITLFGPRGIDGERPIIDQVWLPPLPEDVSFGRSPDGEGPAPVPLEMVRDTFVFNLLGSSSPPSFGVCENLEAPCFGIQDKFKRFCRGAANGPGDNLAPLVERDSHSTNSPGVDEAVEITVRVRDDKDPVGPNIASVKIEYTTRVGQEPAMEHEPVLMTTDGMIFDGAVDGQPLDRWSLWTGEIPGQPEGTRVEFFFVVLDSEGLSSTSPRNLCPGETGPCDREFGGPDCQLDENDSTCRESAFTGERYVECRQPFTYASGYVPQGSLIDVVINEVVPHQEGLLQDETEEGPCTLADGCTSGDPFCCTTREDFIELYNGSAEAVDLSGLWLSDSYFHPRGWQFPAESKILGGEYLIIWIDNDGAQCPDAGREDKPCFWECPDPTDPESQEYHTNFALDFSGDQVYLRDTEENGYGVIHGIDFALDGTAEEVANNGLALSPDGDRGGCYVKVDEASPGIVNPPELCPGQERTFIRGDCDADGKVMGIVTDAVFLLNHNFTGGPRPACLAACDANGDGKVLGIVTDGVYLLTYNFLAGPEPVAPFPDCGAGGLPADVDLGCETVPTDCR